jgi:uncharacterized protein (TIGR03435 family)
VIKVVNNPSSRFAPWIAIALSLGIAVCAWPSIPSFAQATPASPSQTPSATAASAAATPAFEVAAIRPNNSGSGNSSSNTNNGRFTATNVSLKSLIQFDAYGIPSPRILGGPKWLDSARFDVEAKMDDSVTEHLHSLDNGQRRIQTQAMFQQLLAGRFKLAVHWETRELPVYALVVAKKGPKLQPTQEKNGGSGTSSNSNGTSAQFTATGITLPELAKAFTQEMSGELGRVIIDKTGIEGKYDLKLKWAPENGNAATGDASNAAQPDSGPSLFTAIQEQLGLRLEPAKGSVDVLVIDHAEMPSEN